MDFRINKSFAPNIAVDEADVLTIKKALNYLGYYKPLESTGVTDIADRQIFDTLKSFQTDHSLPATGQARPGDATLTKLNQQANSVTGQYIWRTVGDSRVRSSHAALNGTIRNFGDSPAPGQEANCRCWAEPIKNSLGLSQVVISSLEQSKYKWVDEDFINHWKTGLGRGVTLAEIGWLADIVSHAKRIMFHKVEQQIADKAREIEKGTFSDTWERSYNFQEVVYSIGDAVIRGRFTGKANKNEKIIHINAKAYYLLDDAFTDALSIRENILGSSDADILWDNILGDYTLYSTEFGNIPYSITGAWVTKVTGSIKSTE